MSRHQNILLTAQQLLCAFDLNKMTEQTISKPKQRRRSSAKRSKPRDHQEDHDGSDNEEVEDLQKDSDEEELDRLVLGDDAGFLEQLGADTRMSDGGYESSREEAELEEEGGLEGVDDADVCTNYHIFSIAVLTVASFSFWILDRRP